MKKPLIVFLICILFLAENNYSDTVETPVKVYVTRTDAATMSIPRWKGYISPTNVNEIWLCFADWNTMGTHMMYSLNSGTTWNSANASFTNDASCDYHLSIAGDSSGNIYGVSPDISNILLRKFNYPAQSSTDADPVRTVWSVGGNLPRANVMIEPGNQRLWVFTRASGVPSENVRYHYSDNNGVSWTRGIADPTNANEVRVGSMPYIDGRPALIVAYMGSGETMGYSYFLWNGSSFVAEADSRIYTGNIGHDRAFAHNVTSGNYFHLIFGLDDTLYHYWKQYNNGSGNWNSAVIDTSPFNLGSTDWETTCTVRGSELFVFYSKSSSADISSSEIYYAKWTENSQSWTPPIEISTHPENTSNRWPNTVMNVPASSNYIPVFWYSFLGTSNEQIYFNKILVDSTVSRLDIDLKIKDFKAGNATEQEVLDLIEIYNADSIK